MDKSQIFRPLTCREDNYKFRPAAECGWTKEFRRDFLNTTINAGLRAAGFPTSSDIWLELDGQKVAVVQSYNCKATRSSYSVEAFGEEEPVATVQGPQSYVIQLTRLYATDQAIADGLDFYKMRSFSLVICKPDRKVIYSDCQWSDIQEDAQLGKMVVEKLTLVAGRRMEMTA